MPDNEPLRQEVAITLGKLQRQLAQAEARMIKSARRSEDAFRKMNAKVSREIDSAFRKQIRAVDDIPRRFARSFAGGAFAGIGAALSTREVLNYADAWKRTGNSLKVAGIPAEDLEETLDQLFDIAQNAGTGIEATAGLFGKLTQSAEELGASRDDLFKFTKGVGNALKVAGKDAASASGALLQLSQALGGSIVRAEEFNSINEGARPILQAVADGMEEAGGSVAKLRKLVLAGSVTSKAFFEAFLKGSKGLEAQAAKAEQTFSQAFTKIDNALTKYIGRTDEGLGASQRLIQGLNALADNFDQVADVALQVAGILAGALLGRGIAGMLAKVPKAAAALAALAAGMRAAATGGAALRLGLVGVAGAAGPIGLAIGAAAAAAVLFADNADAAEMGARDLVDQLVRLETSGEGASEGIDKIAASLKKLSRVQLAQRLSAINDEIEELRGGGSFFDADRFREGERGLGSLQERLRAFATEPLFDLSKVFGIQGVSDVERRTAAMLSGLITQLNDGEHEAGELKQALDIIARLPAESFSEPVQKLIAELETAIKRLDAATKGAGLLKNELNEVAEITVGAPSVLKTGRPPSNFGSDRGPASSGSISLNEVRKRQFFEQRDVELSKSEIDKEIDRRTEQLVKAAKDAGIELEKSAARIRATKEIEGEQRRARASGNRAAVIAEFKQNVIGPESGGNPRAVNKLGSSASGLAQFVKGTFVEQFRKVFRTEAQEITRLYGGSVSKANTAIFEKYRFNSRVQLKLLDNFTEENAQYLERHNLAITKTNLDLAHLLGKGTAVKVLQSDRSTPLNQLLTGEAIRKNPGFGSTVGSLIDFSDRRINNRRRASGDLTVDERRRQIIDEVFVSLQRKNAELERERDLIGATTAEREKSNAIAEAEQRLREAGVEITPQIRAELEAMGATYGNLKQQIEDTQTSQQAFFDAMGEFNDIARDALGGFIDDLRNGKSATEALENALRRIEDRLIDIALNAIFPSSGQGGLFGGLFGGGGGSSGGGLFGLGFLGLKDGGEASMDNMKPVRLAGGGRARRRAHAHRQTAMPQRLAPGGRVVGPGGPRDDKIPAMLSNGEYVINAAAYRRNPDLVERINAGLKIPELANGGLVQVRGIPALADGGPVQRTGVAELFGPAQTGNEMPGGGNIERLLQRIADKDPQFNLRNINVSDPSDAIGAVYSTPSGEQAAVNMMRRNARAFRGALGLS